MNLRLKSDKVNLLGQIRVMAIFFMIVLIASGITAVPVEEELEFLLSLNLFKGELAVWLNDIHTGIVELKMNYPAILYGMDWLAFGHIVIALSFIGLIKDPLRNKWLVTYAMLACILVIPLALVAGYFREIPIWWRFIDCSFGVLGLAPLLFLRNRIKLLLALETTSLK